MTGALPETRPALSRPERRVIAILLALMAVFSFWLASNQTFDPQYRQPNEPFNTDFYRQQAIAMLDGRLDVPYVPTQTNECFFREGRCYGYFGIVPSVLRIGGFLVGGGTDFNPSPVIIAAGVTVALWAAIDLALGVAAADPKGQRLNATSRMRLIVLVALLLGPGGLLTFLSQAKLYFEAIVLMLAGLLVCFTFVQRWISYRRPGYLLAGLAAGIVATNSRPAALLPVAILGLGVVAITLLQRKPQFRREVMLGSALAVLPAASASGVFWLKLRRPTPSLTQYRGYNEEGIQSLLRANDGQLQGLRFLPTNLVNFLRPDTVGVDGTWPWFRHLLPLEKSALMLPPMNSAGVYVEYSASLTNTMPVALAFTVGFSALLIAGVVRLTSEQLLTFALLLGSAATCCIAVLTSWGLTTRYLGDFVPVLAVGTVFALVSLLHWLEHRPIAAWVVTGAVAGSCLITCVINLNLQQESFLIAG